MIKDHLVEALELFKSGFNCAQSIFSVFSEELCLKKEDALKISCPFGGGLGGSGGTCGALTGGIMVIGMKTCSPDNSDINAKTQSKEKTRALIETFEKIHGSINCTELVGIDRNQTKGADFLLLLPHFCNTCSKYIETVVSYLEEEL